MRRFFVIMSVNNLLNDYEMANYRQISNFKVSMETSWKMLPSTIFKFSKIKYQTKKDLQIFFKITFNVFDANLLYLEANYDNDYLILNNVQGP